jgi:hypothetical protein
MNHCKSLKMQVNKNVRIAGHLFRNVGFDVFVEPPPRVAEQENVRAEECTQMRFVPALEDASS